MTSGMMHFSLLLVGLFSLKFWLKAPPLSHAGGTNAWPELEAPLTNLGSLITGGSHALAGSADAGGGGERVELAAVPPELELVADSSERRFWA